MYLPSALAVAFLAATGIGCCAAGSIRPRNRRTHPHHQHHHHHNHHQLYGNIIVDDMCRRSAENKTLAFIDFNDGCYSQVIIIIMRVDISSYNFIVKLQVMLS